MECFSGKRNNFVPVFRLSLMIFTRIRKLHERCMRHWPGTLCAALTLLSVPLLLLPNVEERTVSPGLSGSLSLDAPLFREPAPLPSGVTAPSPPHEHLLEQGSGLRDVFARLGLFSCSLVVMSVWFCACMTSRQRFPVSLRGTRQLKDWSF